MYGEGLSGLNFPGVEGVSSRLPLLRESCDIGENEFNGKLKTQTNPKNPKLFSFLGDFLGDAMGWECFSWGLVFCV